LLGNFLSKKLVGRVLLESCAKKYNNIKGCMPNYRN